MRLTMIESGVPALKGLVVDRPCWRRSAPRRPIIDRFAPAKIIAGACATPGNDRQVSGKLGAEAKFVSPQEFGAFIADENRRLTAIIRASGVKGD